MSRIQARIARAAFKPFYGLYYRFLFGRRYPLSRRLAGWVQKWERPSGRGDVPLSRQTWNEQYERGQWGFLRGVSELPRYSLIVGFLRGLKPGGSVLDVGCGEAILCRQLRPYGYSRFLGIDLSEYAIARAVAGQDEATSFLVADAETYQPDETFDAIVLNECLYYFTDPLAAARRYFRCLPPDGVLIVSMFRSRRTAAIQRLLTSSLPVQEESRLSNRNGTWMLTVFRAPGPVGAEVAPERPGSPSPSQSGVSSRFQAVEQGQARAILESV